MDKTYSCLVLDPPWRYGLRVTDPTHRNRIGYPSMSFEEILNLPVPDLADPLGCVLWLWFTNNHMIEAGKAIEHWGFTLKGILTWEKVSKSGETRLGVGHWLRNATEHCAICTKGNVKAFSSTSALARATPNLIRAERREHSRKPEEFYQLVRELCPGSKMELFARQRRSGWDCWGNEVDFFEAI